MVFEADRLQYVGDVPSIVQTSHQDVLGIVLLGLCGQGHHDTEIQANSCVRLLKTFHSVTVSLSNNNSYILSPNQNKNNYAKEISERGLKHVQKSN